jgi:hypothetical protein
MADSSTDFTFGVAGCGCWSRFRRTEAGITEVKTAAARWLAAIIIRVVHFLILFSRYSGFSPVTGLVQKTVSHLLPLFNLSYVARGCNQNKT